MILGSLRFAIWCRSSILTASSSLISALLPATQVSHRGAGWPISLRHDNAGLRKAKRRSDHSDFVPTKRPSTVEITPRDNRSLNHAIKANARTSKLALGPSVQL